MATFFDVPTFEEWLAQNPGGSYSEYYSEYPPGEGDEEADGPPFEEEFFWQEGVIDRVRNDIEGIAAYYNLDLDYMLAWYEGHKQDMVDWLQANYVGVGGYGGGEGGMLPSFANPETPEGMQIIFELARKWMGGVWPDFLPAMSSMTASSGYNPGGSGSGLTADSFDINALTDAVQQMSRGLILSEYDGARSLATAYVDAVLASGGEKELDFETFVRRRLLATPRGKSIYRNKPEAMDHVAFIQPYIQAANQMMGPGFGNEASDIAAEQASLAATPDAVATRLMRTDQVQSSSGFLQGLGSQIEEISGVLR